MLQLYRPLVVRGLIFLPLPDCCWCGGVRGGSLSEPVGREGSGNGAGRFFSLLSSLDNQDVTFLDFVVISIIILVLPIHGICGDGMLG